MKQHAFLLLGFSLLLGSREAGAFEPHPLCRGGNSAQASLVGGTVGARMLQDAVQKNSLAFGAASVLDNKVLPSLHIPGAGVKGVFHEDFVTLFNVMRAPLCVNEQGTEIAMGKVDLSNSTVGFAFSKGPFSFFAAGSGTLWSAGRKNHERAGLAFGGFLGWGASLIAPIKRSFFDGLLTTDLILGASLKHDSVGAVGVGYLASQGFFTNLTEHHVRLFATSLISEGFSPDRFPYLNAGISQFDWLLGKELEKKIGYISPYFRQNIFLKSPINFDGKAPESQQGEAPSNPIAKDILLRTLNLDRYGAGDYVDVRLSYAIDPKPQLYEASLVLHTLDFLPERYLLQQAGKDILGGARLTLGVINLPELYYYTVPGGMKPRAQIDAMVYLPDIGFRFYTTFGVNATETLSVLPFAQNALFMGITLNYIAKK